MEGILHKVKNIYLVGIGGVGMSGLAFLLNERGYCVKGSDQCMNSRITALTEAGIEIHIGHKSDHIDSRIDLLCCSSAVKDNNPEILEARKREIPVIKRGQLLAELCHGKRTIAVSGSHGKTTISSLVSHILISLGYAPAVFVGGLPVDCRRNAWWGSDYFVVETDESDGSFLFCSPWVSIITNIDFEHLDYYRSIEHLRDSFKEFALRTKSKIIGCGDDPYVMHILEEFGGISYGVKPHNYIRADNIIYDKGYMCFELLINNTKKGLFKLPMLGKHNCLNALSALAFFNYLGYDVARVKAALSKFKGTARRFEVKANIGGVKFIDDYAHHPSEIRAVLEAAAYLKPKRIFAIFQPHRFSRVKILWGEFINCFKLADELVITDIYSAGEAEISGINGKLLWEDTRNYFPKAIYIPGSELAQYLPELIEEGDLVLALGAGDINNIMAEVRHAFMQKSRGQNCSRA
ncbi:MAG: UDP-N-acetylmuramate--L-alanine ligase [Candidatus Omnitrophota bacterium]